VPDAKEMEAAISSTALVTVQAYRNIAEDPVKRGPLINVRLSLKSTFVIIWCASYSLSFIPM
jgi:hypothetical protein